MHKVDQFSHVFHGGCAANPVTQIKNMPAPALHGIEHAPRLPLNLFKRREQHHRVQVALYAHVAAQAIHATLRSMRQSTPMTSPPASFINLKDPSGARAKVDQRASVFCLTIARAFCEWGKTYSR